MKRIRVADVVSAYNNSSVLPIRSATVKQMGCNTFGCAAAALYAATFDTVPTEDDQILTWFERESGDATYAWGFIRGFDGVCPLTDGTKYPKSYTTGCRDGKAAALAVFGGAS